VCLKVGHASRFIENAAIDKLHTVCDRLLSVPSLSTVRHYEQLSDLL
jgi:hypothetical protein